MLKRPFFWLGLLLGALAAFGPRKHWRGWLPQRFPTRLMDLVEDAVIVCDASGVVTYANAAAQRLSSGETANLGRLYYPSGQRVPPGQIPLNRALRTGKIVEGEGYRYTGEGGTVHVLDVTARPLPASGAVALFRDRTAMERLRAQEALADTQQMNLHRLCRRLCVATDASALGHVIAESLFDMLQGLPEAQAEVFLSNSQAQTITRLAAMPEDRSKRPNSPRKLRPLTVPFDASQPLHWEVYVAKQPFRITDGGVAVYALPLIAGGRVMGHLSLTYPVAAELENAGVWKAGMREAAERVGVIAALALAGPQAADQTVHLAAQVEGLRTAVQAVAAKMDVDALADLITAQVQQVTGAVLCTVSLSAGTGMRLLGNTFQDALLRPETYSAADPVWRDKAAQKAMKTGKTGQKTGIVNPSFEAGSWRSFAGLSGRHSILTVPLARGQGVLTLYGLGATGFSADSVKFAETLAVLFPVIHPASLSESGGGG